MDIAYVHRLVWVVGPNYPGNWFLVQPSYSPTLRAIRTQCSFHPVCRGFDMARDMLVPDMAELLKVLPAH